VGGDRDGGGGSRRGREALRLSGLVLGLGLRTKNEGSVHLLAGVVAWMALRTGARSRRSVLAALAVGAAPFLPR
jgi:hypothetical protein